MGSRRRRNRDFIGVLARGQCLVRAEAEEKHSFWAGIAGLEATLKTPFDPGHSINTIPEKFWSKFEGGRDCFVMWVWHSPVWAVSGALFAVYPAVRRSGCGEAETFLADGRWRIQFCHSSSIVVPVPDRQWSCAMRSNCHRETVASRWCVCWKLEREEGIEPTCPVWKTGALASKLHALELVAGAGFEPANFSL